MIKCLRCSWTLLSLALLAAAPLASQLIPVGPKIQIHPADSQALDRPVLTLDAAGTLLAAWTKQKNSLENDLLVRTFDRSGKPLGPETAVNEPEYRHINPDVAALASGRFVLAWDLREEGYEGTIAARLLGTDGAPLGPELQLNKDPLVGLEGFPQVAASPSGGFRATWNAEILKPIGVEYGLVAQSFDANGAPAGDETLIYDELALNRSLHALQDGGFMSFWLVASFYTVPYPTFPVQPSLWVRRSDGTGQPLTDVSLLGSVEAAAARDGRFAVASTRRPPDDFLRTDSEVFAAFYDREGRRLNETLVAGGPGNEVLEAVAMDEAGRLLVVWSNNLEKDDPYVDADLFARLYSATGQPLGPAFAVASGPGDQFGATVAEKNGEWVISYFNEPANTYWGGELVAQRFATCATDGPSLCLANRFRVEVGFQTGAGHGTGQAVPLTGDTGAFWFFSPDNIELLVKAIDGRSLNDHFWVFYGALSNVAYDLTVTDTVTGEQRVYHNPAGTMASRADTRAFQDPGPPPANVASLAPPESTATEPLHGGRFDVDVTWRIPSTGQTGSGQVVGLTSDSTYVWFFDSSNVELLIKILDGRALNGKYWVFYGALSDVEYTITVTDHQTGKMKTYRNPAGTMASRADTSAF